MPAFRGTIAVLSDEFTILSADIDRTGPSQVVRISANLSRPVEIGTVTVLPFGWGTMPAASFQVAMTTGGALQYCALMLILVLAWPAAGAREYLARAAIGAPLFTLLLVMPLPCTVLAELWNLVRADLEPGRAQPWMIWSRFLMGGGGLALGALCGAVTVALTAALTARHATRTIVMPSATGNTET